MGTIHSANEDPLDTLAQALVAERAALVGTDVNALMAATELKLQAIRAAETMQLPSTAVSRVAELSAMNRANGALLTQRRRHVEWALRCLGRSPADPDYNAAGVRGMRPSGRSLALV